MQEIEKVGKRIHNTKGFPVDYIGKGECGGKANGLITIENIIKDNFPQSANNEINVSIPNMTVIRTDVFTQFMDRNNLWEEALNSYDDNYIAHLFQKASLPATIVGDLRCLISEADEPLAVRSSSLLEDSSEEPFAGVYATKMLPNNSSSLETRFHKLTEAIKFVYSSLFFRDSKDYFRIIGKDIRLEKMALIIQEVVGNRYKDHFYPVISGVARSYNHYPIKQARRQDGVVNLALGLGKTIVDGGWSWLYCPKYPKSPPPFNSIREILKSSQTKFWSVRMGEIPEFNPVSEIEFLEERELDAAEKDNTLQYVCSTYDHQNDVIRPGCSYQGPRLVNFSPVLKYNRIEINNTINKLLDICKEHYKSEIEIEFALKKNTTGWQLGFLQVRAMQVHNKNQRLELGTISDKDVLVSSDMVLGDGEREDIYDIVLVKRENYNPRDNIMIAGEIAKLNKELVNQGKPYLVIGYGRWGSSDPWLGIPVSWSQISGAAAIIEATLPEMKPDLSQGSHFFHNLVAFNIFYLSVQEEKQKTIDWEWLDNQDTEENMQFVKHLSLANPLHVMISSSSNQGVIFK